MSLFPEVNLKALQWKPTLFLHLLRSVAAGIVWGLVLLLTIGNTSDGPPWWAMPFVMPFVYFLGAPFYLLIAKVAAAFGELGQAFGGFVMLVLAIGIVVGDPLVCLLWRQRPDLVPVHRFRLFNFVTILFVTGPGIPSVA